MIAQSLWLVRAQAAELHRLHQLSLSVDDLEGYGRCGLLRAVDDFDESRSTRFTTFAYYAIRGAMLDALRDGAGDFTRSELVWMNRLREEQAPAADAEGPETLGALRKHLHQQVAASYEASTDVTSSCPLAAVERAEVAAAVRAAIARLPERERQLVEHLHFEPNATLSTAAARFGVDRTWLCRVHARAQEALRQALADLEP
jgi:RNA polymerase sigma factor (sigma-70 family)